MQIIIAHSKLLKNGIIFLQTDGGHNNQEVRLISKYNYMNKIKKRVKVIWQGLFYCAKSSDQVVISMKNTAVFGYTLRILLDGSFVDSGQGTPGNV